MKKSTSNHSQNHNHKTPKQDLRWESKIVRVVWLDKDRTLSTPLLTICSLVIIWVRSSKALLTKAIQSQTMPTLRTICLSFHLPLHREDRLNLLREDLRLLHQALDLGLQALLRLDHPLLAVDLARLRLQEPLFQWEVERLVKNLLLK